MRKFVCVFFQDEDITFEDLEVEANHFVADNGYIKFIRHDEYGPVALVPMNNLRYVREVDG